MKKTTTLLFLLAVVAGFYALAVNAKGQGSEPTPNATAQPSPTMTPTVTACIVTTGIDGGAVNLRTCAGVSCAVVDIASEGERLTVLQADAWMNVTTESGVTGYINSKYCKGK